MSMSDTQVCEQMALTCMGAAGTMLSEFAGESAMGVKSKQTPS